MLRHLVLFAREPGREAREKGLAAAEAAELFTWIARGWREAAQAVGAKLVLATPPEDRMAWSRRLGESRDSLWIGQRGSSFGERLADTVRQAAALGGRAVVVGGDVPPSARDLADAFRALEGEADAVLSPAPDGGVSLIGLSPADIDLLASIAPRRKDVFERLRAGLLRRRRNVELLARIPDIDSRASLRRLLANLNRSSALAVLTRAVLLRASVETLVAKGCPRIPRYAESSAPRGPPAGA